MKRRISTAYQRYLEGREESVLEGEAQQLGMRGFWVGSFLSFFLAAGDPYGNMVMRGTYMANDFNTPGAIFLFLFLIGVLNLVFKVAARSARNAVALAALMAAGWLGAYWPLDDLDLYSPGLLFASFMLLSSLVNVPVVSRGGSLALNRAELILVYAMLLIVSALCTMGLGEQILPMITAIFYFASPENQWAEKLLPHLPDRHILVNDGTDNQLFYEGAGGQGIPYGDWIEPLMWWGIFLLALYVTMVSVAVVLRRQWMERERLAYPVAQVGLAMVRGEEAHRLTNGLFRQPAVWLGAAIPLLVGTLRALHSYDPSVPVPALGWTFGLGASQNLRLDINFATVGFSYFISAHLAAGICFFHLVAKLQKALFVLLGVTSVQKIVYGAAGYTLLGYQGAGAMVAMVLVGLWVGREHLRNVLLKALGRAPEVDDRDEIMSYFSATLGVVGGILVMGGWLWLMGTPFWISMVFVVLAMFMFIGITRIVTEAGLVMLRAPMIAPDLVVQGLGSALVGPTGVINLSLAYIWAADVRVFVMGTCANSLRLVQEMAPRCRRIVLWAIVLALLIGVLGSIWMIFHMVYRHGAVNISNWFFLGAPGTAYDNAVRNLEPSGVYWPGLAFFLGGGVVMALMMWGRQRLPWWPVHPIGFPIGANTMTDGVWFSVFLAWVVKKTVLRYGGAAVYQRTQGFFLGLIAGQVLCSGAWLVIDYFTGKVGNHVF